MTKTPSKNYAPNLGFCQELTFTFTLVSTGASGRGQNGVYPDENGWHRFTDNGRRDIDQNVIDKQALVTSMNHLLPKSCQI